MTYFWKSFPCWINNRLVVLIWWCLICMSKLITIYRRSISPTNQEGSVVDACVAWHRTRLTVWQLSALAEPPYRRFHTEIWICWSFYLEVSNRRRVATSPRTCFYTFCPNHNFEWKVEELWKCYDPKRSKEVATFSNLGAKFWFICSTGL